ncbi:MAG: efflux RND transporter permease subunit [Pirellulales bacterium]|nr:efflux RND transporter permease subunit [Pirellulales bacterium]
MDPQHEHHWLSRIVEVFLRGNLAVLLILISLIAGAIALLVTPREEEPQIVVPLADVFVQMPGASAEEVEQQVSTRLERLLYQIDGVEYVYSMSRPGMAIVTVRFYVGENREDSLVKLYNKISMNTDMVPPGVAGWVVKPVEIDDVPIVNVTLWSKQVDGYVLRRVAEQVEIALQSVPNTGRTEVIGGTPRQILVQLDPEALAARNLTPLEVAQVLRGANVNVPAGSFSRQDRQWLLESGPYILSTQELEQLVVGVFAGRPVYLRDVVTLRNGTRGVYDGPEETTTYTQIGFGPASEDSPLPKGEGKVKNYPAVTVAVAKRHGANAVWVARDIEKKLEELRGTTIPSGVEIQITRNYGETANDKVNELIEHLTLAVIIVVGLIGFALGWREAAIVVAAVPITFALTLLINYLAGYSINRVTLFALILSLGLVVDDPIVDVENIFRHFKMRKEPPLQAVLTAVNEVRPPVILATLVVILSFVPMLFITGMMGPYMRPMALNVPVAMLMSMVVAFTITPWMSYHVLKGEYGKEEKPFDLERSRIYRIYRAILGPFLARRIWAWLLILGTAVLFFLSVLLPVLGLVPLKMLPFDNKNEFQIVVDMPEGTTLETTDAAVQALTDSLRTVPEVTNFVTFVGTASPMDFNGMVRHYYLRRGPNVAEIRVNLVKKGRRKQQSHALLLRLRNGLTKIGREHGANLKLVESPPGPPVFATLVAEIYGRPEKSYAKLIAAARHVRKLMETEPGVVDVDDTVEADQEKFLFVVDKVKASLSGVSSEVIGATLRLAEEGYSPGSEQPLSVASGSGILHTNRDLNPVPIVLRLSRPQRSSLNDLSQLSVKTASGKMLRLVELGRFEKVLAEKTIYHKNLRRVVYVFGDVAGQSPVNAILGLESRLGKSPTAEGTSVDWSGEGEWKITLDVFRDLGIAFAGALLGIYILQVWQTGSYVVPLVLMISIPLTVIGIMPGFWLLDVLGNHPVGGYSNPVFFTATAMIGMIALAGLADRNAILLIEFVHSALERGLSLKDALVQSGAVRLRPIVLTSGAAMLGAWPITLDPVFSGLAWALIFGLVVSTAFTLLLIPVIYWLLYAHAPRHGLPAQNDLTSA